jgi:hypothetical protein
MKVVVNGWKSGRDVNPISLLKVLRDVLRIDLPDAKALLDRFSEEGELEIDATDDALERLQKAASEKGIEVTIGAKGVPT